MTEDGEQPGWPAPDGILGYAAGLGLVVALVTIGMMYLFADSASAHHGWSSSPVFEVDFRSVFRGDRIHFRFSLIIPMWVWSAHRF
jgi:hypothetical protein